MYQILLVDDEPIVKIALRSILPWEQYGFQICGTASNGEEALQLVNKFRPHMVITDLKMPVMDGIELIRTLKNQDYKGEILVLSNYEDFDSVRSALVLGAADYLLKVSIDADTLLAQLKKALHKFQDKEQLSSDNAGKDNSAAQREIGNNILKEFLLQEATAAQFSNAQAGAEFLRKDDHYSLCYVSFDQYVIKEGVEFSKTLIKSTVLEALQEYSNSGWFALDHYNLLIYLSVEDVSKNEKVKQFANKLSTRFQVYQSLNPVILYDWDAAGYDQLHKVYQTLLEVLKLRFYGELSVENAKELYPQHYMSFAYYKDVAEKIRINGAALMEESLKMISDIVTTCKEQKVHPEILRKFFVKVVEFIEFLVKDITLQTHEYLAETKEFLRFCRESRELISYMELSLRAIFEPQEIHDLDILQYKNEINKALQYIEDNYQQKITLTSIAEHVNFSSNYLCKSFKNEVGLNVVSYINNLRMKKAGEMLKQKDSLVKEVAMNVGIDDQLYFSRLFKKYYGKSPSEYKNVYM